MKFYCIFFEKHYPLFCSGVCFAVNILLPCASPGKLMGLQTKSEASSVHVSLVQQSANLQLIWTLKKSAEEE